MTFVLDNVLAGMTRWARGGLAVAGSKAFGYSLHTDTIPLWAPSNRLLGGSVGVVFHTLGLLGMRQRRRMGGFASALCTNPTAEYSLDEKKNGVE